MDTIGYLILVCMGVLVLLVIRGKYIEEQLKRYIDRHYPEEGKYIRSHEGDWYPWAKWGKVMRELIKKHGISDVELAQRAKKLNRSSIHFLVWLVLLLLMFAVLFIYL